MSKILKRLANEMEFVSLCCVLRAAHQLGLLDDKLHKGLIDCTRVKSYEQ